MDVALFKGMNGVGLLQRQTDIVEPIKQAMAAESIDLEMKDRTRIAG